MKKTTILVLILFSIIIVINEFYVTQKKQEIPLIRDLVIKKIDFSNIWSNNLEQKNSYDKVWNVISIKKEDNKSKSEAQKSFHERVFVEQSKKTICIKGSCYRFLATSKDIEKQVILYNEKMKPKMKAFSLHDILENRVKIVRIDNYVVHLQEINGSERWQLKMFDINLTKYKPKEIE